MTITESTATPAPFRLGVDENGREVWVRGAAPMTATHGPAAILEPFTRRVFATFTVEDGYTDPAEVITVEAIAAHTRGAEASAHALIVRRTPRGGAVIITEHATADAAMSTALEASGWGPLEHTAEVRRAALAEVDPLG
jgi:hypothetical protein